MIPRAFPGEASKGKAGVEYRFENGHEGVFMQISYRLFIKNRAAQY
jgi:hypothetical protein